MTANDNTAPLVESFERGGADLPGGWLSPVRGAAIRDFAEAGFPTPRTESWKYTNLGRLTRKDFDPLADVPAVDAAAWTDLFVDGCDRIVVVNGRYDAANSVVGALPDGVVLAPLSEAVEGAADFLTHIAQSEDAPLVALNTAFMRDGLVLRVPRGTVLERPVQIVHIVDGGGTALSVHPRTLVVAEEGAEATVIETFAGSGEAGYWTNAVTEIRVGANARIRHVKRQSEALTGFHTAVTQARLDRDARYGVSALATGATLSRNEIRVSFEGEGAECEMSGAALLRGRQHADTTTLADHRVPHTDCRQVFRNVADGHARVVFQGGVTVRQDAQKTDSSQSSRSLLLAAGAQADAKPELRIFADDVKCAHGATVGDLDRAALFYLESRGVPPAEARALLIRAFVGEVLETVPEGAVRDHLDGAIAAWMDNDGGEND